jgi:Glycosyl transferase family 2
MAPLVSIIVNSYNYERYVAKAIESALGQDYQPVEVIAVDDGSTDLSGEVIESFRDRVQTLVKPNGGQASALNAGFELSSGEIVIFLDCDDYLFGDAVSSIVAGWRPDCSKVQYRLAIVDADGRPTGGSFPAARIEMPSGDVVPMMAEAGVYIWPVTTGNAFSRRALEQVMPIPEEDFRLSADGYMNSLVPFYGPVVSMQGELGAYRLHGANRWVGLASEKDLLRHVDHDLLKQRYILSTARAVGRPMPEDLSLRDWSQVLHRLALLRIGPGSYPVAKDTRFGLARAGARAVWRSPELAGAERAFYALVIVAIAAAPRPLAGRLVAWTMASKPRPAVLRGARRALRALSFSRLRRANR